MLHYLELLLELLVEWGILFFEVVGVLVILKTGIMSVYMGIKKKPKMEIYLAKGLSLGLQFKLGSEILRTVLIREWTEIGIIAGIIVLRAIIALLIHWEMKHSDDVEKGKAKHGKKHENTDHESTENS